MSTSADQAAAAWAEANRISQSLHASLDTLIATLNAELAKSGEPPVIIPGGSPGPTPNLTTGFTISTPILLIAAGILFLSTRRS